MVGCLTRACRTRPRRSHRRVRPRHRPEIRCPNGCDLSTWRCWPWRRPARPCMWRRWTSSTPDEAFDYERLVGLINDRIAFVPRYRQKVRQIPGRVANPVWVDDEDFDLAYHVRRSALPRPGSMEQLRDLVARIMSRRLDRNRPLWETYLVEGLEDGRYAVLSKSHQALVDGTTVDIGQLLVDDTPDRARDARHQLDARAPARGRRAVQPGARATPSATPRSRPTTCAVSCVSARRATDRVRSVAAASIPAAVLRRRPVCSVPSSRSSGASSPSTPDCRPTARSARSTVARSTTSCWPPSPEHCAAGS